MADRCKLWIYANRAWNTACFRTVNSEKITETLKLSAHRPVNENSACTGYGSFFGRNRYERSHPGLILDETPAIMSNFTVALLSPS